VVLIEVDVYDYACTMHIIYVYWSIILTYSMVQSPSWEANWFAASQEIPRISRNPKVHYRTHNRPPPVSILGQPNPVRIPTFHLLEIHPNIIHPSTPRSPQWSLSLPVPHQDPIRPPLQWSVLYIQIYTMHVYSLALESAASTLLLFWLRACILPNLGRALNNVLLRSVFLTVPLLLQNFFKCG